MILKILYCIEIHLSINDKTPKNRKMIESDRSPRMEPFHLAKVKSWNTAQLASTTAQKMPLASGKRMKPLTLMKRWFLKNPGRLERVDFISVTPNLARL